MIPVILDTDVWSDVDDALALAMLHTLADRGVVDLVAVTISTSEESCAAFVRQVGRHRGRPDIPVGIVRGGIDARTFAERVPHASLPSGSYTATVTPAANVERDPGPIEDATSVLRAALAARADGSVVVIQIGFSTNLARLLDSPPDAVSPLDGRRLVARKVRLLSVMAGAFETADPEFNVLMDIASARRVFDDWPTEIVVSPAEVGAALSLPPERLEAALSDGDPVRAALRSHHLVLRAPDGQGSEYRWPFAPASFDLTSVLQVAAAEGEYFGFSARGRVRVNDDGATVFTPVPDGRHRYLVRRPERAEAVVDAMIELVATLGGHNVSKSLSSRG